MKNNKKELMKARERKERAKLLRGFEKQDKKDEMAFYKTYIS